LTSSTSLTSLADSICKLLSESGGLLGFVTATHYADRIPEILEAVPSADSPPRWSTTAVATRA
jgi:hypothetical protein